MAKNVSVSVTVNGKKYEQTTEARTLLSDFLRHQLYLTGTHVGCEHGVCGACTVMLNGRTTRSCLTLAAQANGAEILTVEGLAGDVDNLHPIQQAFWENHGLQCGFCTPGLLITCYELLKANPDPNEQEVRSYISGNICRCTGYHSIVAAVLDAAKRMKR